MRHTLKERYFLQTLDNPYIIKLRYAFQDSETIYMGLDLYKVGNLKGLMNSRRFPIDSKDILLFAAEISYALSYLHKNSIIHRQTQINE